MPRKKTVQPLPLEELTLDDGTIVDLRHKEYDVRDGTCQEIGRGLHKRDAFEGKRDEVLLKVADDYLTPQGKKVIRPEKDYLSSGSKFAKEIALRGLCPFGGDDSAIRKKLYKDIKKHIGVLERCINDNNQPT